MANTPDFSKKTIDTLSKRSAQMCSNPHCRRTTSGPHSEPEKAINLGEAAHIKGARLGAKRYDPNMSDEERSHISNGIWLCGSCAKEIDTDDRKFTVELLSSWKEEHERAVTEGRHGGPQAAREISVKGGGIGSMVENSGDGVALDVVHEGKGPAERITVEGKGVGEIISNTGRGTAKRVVSTGGGTASETSVRVTQPVRVAVGLSSTVVVTNCSNCGREMTVSKIIQGFAGDELPKVEAKCRVCGASTWI